MQELYNVDSEGTAQRHEIEIEEFIYFFRPGNINGHLYIQAAGVWAGFPLLFPVNIEQTYRYFKFRKVARVTVAEMSGWPPRCYFLTYINFA